MFVKEKFIQGSVYSSGIRDQLDSIRNFLPDIRNIDYKSKRADCILGWGYKTTSIKARKIARENKIPYFALEDGFISSIGLNGESMPRSSLVIDKRGIYYNARSVSDLELILEKKDFSKELLERAKKCLEFIKTNRITKYNCDVDLKDSPYQMPVGNNVLLIDQTYNDHSVLLGSNGQEDFDKMFEFAKDKFPNANILIKTHPDVISGKKKGYLKKYFSRVGVYPIVENINIHSLIEKVDAVLTVTSLSGMEALISGAVVYCFGTPFYAGWGLTRDQVKLTRRKRGLSLEKLFAGAYILYPRYLNPYTKKLCQIEELLEIIASIKNKNKELIKPLYCVGFTYWKKDNVRKLLKTPNNKIRYCFTANSAVKKARSNNGEVAVWASRETEKLRELCKKYQVKLNRVEDGFIRSVGLGSDLTPALSLVFDRSGIYYNANEESDIEAKLNKIQLNEPQRKRVKNLIDHINNNSITKYNFDSKDLKLSFPRDKKIILVPGQSEEDASILSSKSKVKTNRKLLEITRKLEPDSFIIYKPHPDVVSGNKKGHIPKKVAGHYANAIIENVSITDLIERVDAVYTISSLVGFEALLKGKEVRTLGTPFYAGWGLTFDLAKFPRRKSLIDIESLAYATLIDYPRYLDPVTGIICDPEILIERIILNKSYVKKTENSSFQLRVIKFFKNLIRDINKSFD